VAVRRSLTRSSENFSNGEDLFATTSGDRKIRLWDLRQTTAPPTILTSHSTDSRQVSTFESSIIFSPDNAEVAAVNVDSTVDIWPIWSAAAQFLCEKRIWRSLSDTEFRLFIGGDVPRDDPCKAEPKKLVD
jgi:WD40 repeat protein